MAQQPQKKGAPAPAAGVSNNQDAGGIFVDSQDATDLAPREFAEGDGTGFLDNMRASFDSTLRSGLMVSGGRSRYLAYQPIMDALNQGVSHSEQLTNPYKGRAMGVEGRIRPHEGTLGFDFSAGWAGVTPEEQDKAVWAAIGRRRAADPGFLPGIPRSREELHAKIDNDDRQALEADDDVAKRATVWGSAGGFVGGVGASFRDPVNVLSLPLGGGAAKSILGAAVREGAINAGMTAIAQPAIAARNRELGRSYGLDEAVTSTLYGGIGGAVLGAGAKGLEKGARVLGNRIGLAQMHRITEGAESRGRDYDANGNVLTSSAGAQGRMQVMPGTNLDPGYGVRPAADGSLKERARVGRDYLGAMMREYKNDPRKAWAAYNWGPGNLNKAIERHGAGWFDHAPAETQKYVTNNMRQLGRQVGYGANWIGPAESEAAFPPASSDQVSAAITLEGLDELGRTSPLPASPTNDVRHLETLQTHIDALEDGAPRPEARAEPIELKRPDEVRLDRYDPRELAIDPERFQFKGGGDADGVLDTLKGVREWNPILSGKAVVWVDEGGKPHVADGHQRVGLARRLLGENPAADIKIDAVTLRAEDGITSEMARTWAALKNVAEGSGSPIDAAKVLRATGENTPIPLPPRSALVRDARSLAALSDDAFGMVVNEVVPPSYAALVGRLAPAAPELHAAYLQLLHRLEPATLTQAESIVHQAIAAGATRETQLGLFGEEIVSRSLYLERARVLDNSLRRLKNDKRIFRTLIDARDDIEAAGNALATDRNAAKVENNAQALEILSRLAHRTGPVSDALGRAAGELAAGRSAKSVVDRFIAELDGLDLSELARGVERGPGDGNAPGGLGREGGVEQPDGSVSRGAKDGAPAGDAGGADDGLGEPIGTDLFGNPVYAERAELDELDGPAALETAVDDTQAGLQLEQFTDPHGGAGPARQTELLEHDVRRDAEKAQQAAQGAPGSAIAAPGTKLTRDTVAAGQRGMSLDILVFNAGTNQGRLNRLGPTLAGDGADFIAAKPKTRESIERKVRDEGYAEPGELLDLARASFIVDSEEAGNRIAAELGTRYAALDKGWKKLGSGYLDRKLIVQFPNGGTGEVQIIPRKVYEYKKAGGHALYAEQRLPATMPERRAAIDAEMSANYEAALADWTGHDSGSGTSGKARENSSIDSGSPSDRALPTTAGADRHSLSDQANPSAEAPPLDTTATGRSSSSNNRTFMDSPPEGDVGNAGAIVNAPLSWRDPAVREAVAAHNEGVTDRAAELELGEAGQADPQAAGRQAELAELGAKAPLRSVEEQADVDGLGLFDAVRSPELFAIGERLDDGQAVPELRSADDLLAELDADDAAWSAIEKCLV